MGEAGIMSVCEVSGIINNMFFSPFSVAALNAIG
jgi:hypothetical protein